MSAASVENPVQADVRPATDYGWLKRPELAGAVADVWELPDGSLLAVPIGNTPCVVTLKRGFQICEVIEL